jgi:uncharacterized protein YjlB
MVSCPFPTEIQFTDDGVVPNNRLPMLFYRGGLGLFGDPDPAGTIERYFAKNDWGHGMWRNGIYPFVHYHSQIHEALGIAAGTAKVRFGGESGKTFDLAPGDIAILPAGTGHQCLSASDDLLVVGGYPPEGEYDLCRGTPAERIRALGKIRRVPVAKSDPLYGATGPLTMLWR